MALPLYLAMTAAELSCAPAIPECYAYMACHFSSYGTGLSNIPRSMPKDSLLIVNDRTPVQGHDPKQIADQLLQAAEDWELSGILLDFQRPDDPLTTRITEEILSNLPCPVGISPQYQKPDCPVFLPPPPPDIPLSQYISDFQGRQIWLEAAMDSKALVISENGCRECTPPLMLAPCKHRDTRLHCSYDITVQPDHVQFSLHRTAEDLRELLEEAEELGITKAIGLYQELGEWFL